MTCIIILLICTEKENSSVPTNPNLSFFSFIFFFFFFLRPTMSSMISAQGVVFATAMAVSGTVILLALRLQRSFPPTQFTLHQVPPTSSPILRSCLSSDEKKRERMKKKKRVHFAEDVMDSCRDGEEFRRQQGISRSHSLKSKSESSKVQKNYNGGTEIRGMPANRVALYNGILRDRVAQRLAYSC